jgi:2-oxoglutarate dehydrogenase E2 component (dihydrolipoamide succinyltransferase)
MAIEIKAPAFPESVADGEVAAWHKQEGEAVQRDELIVEIETDKVVLEVVAPADGVLEKIMPPRARSSPARRCWPPRREGAAASPRRLPALHPRSRGECRHRCGECRIWDPAARQLVEEHKLDPRLIPALARVGASPRKTSSNYLESGP